ncbi:LANO_0G03862g1_1 [Lachancea nothofagi CBS 11611]|uniref:Autophagy-related protein 27 n=1 Tax=Lachancea nothofagi CBS 11611 TaxID=1266666 RepID=A0A1G4KFX8_9SACH|nr:LANO_0G03862g1_1 [Lachancea nothofagi CBS 11611]
MKLSYHLSLGWIAAQVAYGFKCSDNEILKKYRVDESAIAYSSRRDTPPSTTVDSWWMDLCHVNAELPSSACQRGDVLCGETKVIVKDNDDEKTILTQLIDFPESVSSAVSENDKQELVVELKDAKWGSNSVDAALTFICVPEADSNEVTSLTWEGRKVQMLVKGKAGCLKKRDDKEDGGDSNGGGNNGDNDGDKHGKPDKKRGSSIGSWFLWLVTYALLFALIYLLATSYMSTRGGNFREFREEFVDRSTSLASSLPQFTKEIFNKVVGRSSSSQRGGYSAV